MIFFWKYFIFDEILSIYLINKKIIEIYYILIINLNMIFKLLNT
jgi:hypothetical protein